jgi:phage terminase large subunit-like protein
MVDKSKIITLLDIENELKKRQPNEKLSSYNKGEKIHLKQVAFHKCLKRNRWVFGGNRSGKTECGAVETVLLARGLHPYRKNKKQIDCWVVSLTREVQRDVAQKKILEYINPYWIKDITMVSGKKDSPLSGVIDSLMIKTIFGGVSTIGFKSCDQGREKFQGTSLDFVWFDEEPPKDIYDECKMRVIDRKGDIFGTMTPLKGLTWVYDTIYLNPTQDNEVWYEFMEWADNPFLDSEEIKNLTKSMSNDELESRRFGKFVGNGGAVYSEFDENINVVEPFNIPIDWYDTLSIDPGLHNPLSCHWYAQDFDGNIYVIAEHYASDKDIYYHADRIKEISKRLNWPFRNGKIDSLIDSAASQRTLSGTKSVAELFYELGICANTNVNKDLFTGISKVKNYIKDGEGKSHLFIFKTCTNMIREIKGYTWSENDAPYKRDDHSLDELRYYIMSKQKPFISPKNEKSLIALDKEKMYKKLSSLRR